MVDILNSSFNHLNFITKIQYALKDIGFFDNYFLKQFSTLQNKKLEKLI